MAALRGLATIGGFVFCCGALFVLILVALVLWYWRNQPAQESSPVAPEPPIQATIEHPTAAAPAAPAAPSTPSDSVPPSADA